MGLGRASWHRAHSRRAGWVGEGVVPAPSQILPGVGRGGGGPRPLPNPPPVAGRQVLSGEDGFSVTFWGVRGSIACPGPETMRYGGNTSCIEVRCGRDLLIFHAGTGLRALGQKLVGAGPVDADLFFSHTPLDHFTRLPFFPSPFSPPTTFPLSPHHLPTR